MEHLGAASRGAGQQAFLSISHEPLAAFSSHVTGHVLLGPSIHPGVKASVQACVHKLVGLKEITGTRHKGTSQTVCTWSARASYSQNRLRMFCQRYRGERKKTRQTKKKKRNAKIAKCTWASCPSKVWGKQLLSQKTIKINYFHIILIHRELDTNQVNIILYEKNVEYIIVWHIRFYKTDLNENK